MIPNEKYGWIQAVHNSIVGHHGVKRTREMLAEQGQKWHYMPAHVTQFIRQCPMCQKLSQVKPVVHIAAFTVSSLEPMVRRAIDTVGPFLPDSEG